MELKIRGVDAAVVKAIDEQAGRQKLSRSAYLARCLERFAALDAFQNQEARYRELEEKSLRVIESNTEVLLSFINFFRGLETN